MFLWSANADWTSFVHRGECRTGLGAEEGDIEEGDDEEEEEGEDPEAADTEDESGEVSEQEPAIGKAEAEAEDEDGAEAEEEEDDQESGAKPAPDQGGPGELIHCWADTGTQLACSQPFTDFGPMFALAADRVCKHGIVRRHYHVAL